MKNIEFETAKTYEQIMKEIHNVSERYYNKNTGEMWAFYEEEDYYHLIGNAGFKYSKDVEIGTFIPAPLQEEVIEWLWNEHKIYVQSTLQLANELCHDHNFSIIIKISENRFVIRSKECDKRFANRNEAMEYGIIEALKLINYGTK